MALKSYKNKVVDFGIKSDSFKNDAGEIIDYSQIVVVLELDGDREEIVLSGDKAPKPKLLNSILKGADNVIKSGNLLDDDER